MVHNGNGEAFISERGATIILYMDIFNKVGAKTT